MKDIKVSVNNDIYGTINYVFRFLINIKTFFSVVVIEVVLKNDDELSLVVGISKEEIIINYKEINREVKRRLKDEDKAIDKLKEPKIEEEPD